MRSLTPDRWHRIDEVFARALEMPAPEREAWLKAACEGDDELHRAVQHLLDSTGPAEAALGESFTGIAGPALAGIASDDSPDDPAPLPLNGRIGAYRLIREVGRGGMGAVYLAERADSEFEKRVALKLVKRGMDTDEILLRFRYERQILASLEHPNIARLYDGGATEDGRPYLVMEYVEGAPITRYCDEHRLPVEARLRLFADVCRAIQFAHANLVVHRDIKPSNILVLADGTAKLLDFGIAKLLDPAASEQAPRTRAGFRLLTPEYAAPEQLEGGAVTTVADVYSLGVLLFELLTGRRPDPAAGDDRPSAVLARRRSAASSDAEQASVVELAARRGTTPERLRRRLLGDLDTISAAALAPDPSRRYPTAALLLTDVERHLQGLPITARGVSLGYRAAAFARRYRVAVTAAALVVLSLVGGSGVALWQAAQAARERDQAEQERGRAEEVSSFLLGLFEAANPEGEERLDTLRARDLVDRGVERIRRDPPGSPRLRAQMLGTLGHVYVSLGLFPQAEALLGDALARASASTDFFPERVQALKGLADVAERRADYDALDTLHLRVISEYEAHGREPDLLYANSLSGRGGALELLGRREEAVALHERALTLVARLDPRRGKNYASVLSNLATHHVRGDEHARAEPLLREVLEIDRGLYGADHPYLAVDYNNLASSIHYQGRHEEAEPWYREALATGRRGYGADHPNVAQFAENLATLLADRGAHAEAEQHYREALRVLTLVVGPDNPRAAILQRNLALTLNAVGDHAAAEALLLSAAATFEAELGPDHLYTLLTRASLGRTLTAAGRPGEALPLLRESIAMLERVLPSGSWRIDVVRGDLGAALGDLGDTAAAESLLLASHAALLEEKGPDDYATRHARELLYRFYTTGGHAERAATFAAEPGG
jgi:eukaryotic-like serine/threonine-protein kinase